jgi:hypothetical protein
MSWLTRSLGPKTLDRITYRRQDGLWFDGIELSNPAPTAALYMPKARRLNSELYKIPIVGASDAHFVQAIGSGYTKFAGRSALDLKRAFETQTTTGHETSFPSLRQVGFRRALAVPLAGLAATPRRLGWRRTAWSFVSRYMA